MNLRLSAALRSTRGSTKTKRSSEAERVAERNRMITIDADLERWVWRLLIPHAKTGDEAPRTGFVLNLDEDLVSAGLETERHHVVIEPARPHDP